MILHQPVWLLLLIPLALFLALKRPPRTIASPIFRAFLFLLLTLALCQPALKIYSRSGTLVVLADCSESMPLDNKKKHTETVNLLLQSMNKDDRLAVVSFGRKAVVERTPGHGNFAGFVHDIGSDQSNLNEAIQTAVSLIPPGTPGRLLVLSDGLWTGQEPLSMARRAAGKGIAVDYRYLGRRFADDTAIMDIETPSVINPEESFLIKSWIRSPDSQNIEYTLSRNRMPISQGMSKVPAGTSLLMFRDRAQKPGTNIYTLSIKPQSADTIPENNRVRFLTAVRGPHPVLYIGSRESGLLSLLKKGGIDLVPMPGETANLSLEELSAYSAILLENVTASTLGVKNLENIAHWVENTGAGLMITGGKKSYGPGGYYKSPLERIMPVSMELRQEHRKFAIGLAIVLDRSGSMAAETDSGKTKMDLANLGAVQVLDMLSEFDEFAVIAVDSVAHTIVSLTPVDEDRDMMRNKVLRIDSMGGGIFVYQGLLLATRTLNRSEKVTRHIILFADAADAEEPGKYKELIEECTKAGITVSAIGLGEPTDVDADFLRDIAKRGMGRCLFTNSPEEIPSLFIQDMFEVSRSAFIEEETKVAATGRFAGLTHDFFDNIPNVGGYNLCYVRPEANLSVVTQDEYKAPVVVYWHSGPGRVLCYTGEADGEFAGPIASWEKSGRFFSSLMRWTKGENQELPANMLADQVIENGLLKIRLHLDPEREKDVLAQLPEVNILRGMPGQTPEASMHVMQWAGADLLELSLPVSGKETVVPTLSIPGMMPYVMSPVCLPYSPEFVPAETGRGLETLERIAALSGGKERINLADIWKGLPKKPRYLDITHWVLYLAIICFLYEIFVRRTGIRILRNISFINKFQFISSSKEKEDRPQKPSSGLSAVQEKLDTMPEDEEEDKEGKADVDAFKQAMKRAKDRMK